MFYFDTMYLVLVMPAFLFSMWAQHQVTSTFNAFSRQRTRKGLTGAEAAREVLRKAGVTGVRIEKVAGNLTDHFDPRGNVIRLSNSVHDVPSVAAVGVAAHEAGHAIQYANGYTPMKLRAAIIPITSVGSKLSIPLVIVGFIIGMSGLINLGILLFGTVVLFQLITLPVEFDASRKAIDLLCESGQLASDEIPATKKVLSAAAMTYVGALAVSLAQLIHLISMVTRRN